MKCLDIDVNKVADYICWKFMKTTGQNMPLAKLHKILYYSQAHYLALYGKAIFEDDFHAWAYGPVCRTIFDRYKGKLLPVVVGDMEIDPESFQDLPVHVRAHVVKILNMYGNLSFTEIEEYYISREKPWLEARAGLSNSSREVRVIPKTTMMLYHRRTLRTQQLKDEQSA